jgi:hypothetical protein
MLSKLKSVVQFRVQRWHISMRGWNEQDTRVLIVCESDIWYWALLLFLGWDCATHVCEWLHYIKLPRWLRNWKRQWDSDRDFGPCTFEEYYGDDLSTFWHVWVESPLCQFAWKHRNYEGDVEVELTIDEARKKFAHDLDSLKWIEETIERYAAEEAAEKSSKASE